MTNPKATITQSEVARYRQRHARGWNRRIFDQDYEKPDGTKIFIDTGKASETAETGDDIDAMIEKLP